MDFRRIGKILVSAVISLLIFSIILINFLNFSLDNVFIGTLDQLYDRAGPISQSNTDAMVADACAPFIDAKDSGVEFSDLDESIDVLQELCTDEEKMQEAIDTCMLIKNENADVEALLDQCNTFDVDEFISTCDEIEALAENTEPTEYILDSLEQCRSFDAQGFRDMCLVIEQQNVDVEAIGLGCDMILSGDLDMACSSFSFGDEDSMSGEVTFDLNVEGITAACDKGLEGKPLFMEVMKETLKGVDFGNQKGFKKVLLNIDEYKIKATATIVFLLSILLVLLFILNKGHTLAFGKDLFSIIFRVGLLFIIAYLLIVTYLGIVNPDTSLILDNIGTGDTQFIFTEIFRALIPMVFIALFVIFPLKIFYFGVALAVIGLASKIAFKFVGTNADSDGNQ